MKIATMMILTVAMTGLIMTVPAALAAEVSVPEGSGVPGCEETDECWLPSVVTVDVGETVTWLNDDTAAHTVTSGTAADGPDGAFDSSLFMAGASFEATFDEAGTFEYFCMVHPWMVGTVIVGEAMAEEEMMDETMEEEMMKDDIYVELEHDITGGEVIEMEIDTRSKSLIIEVNTVEDGSITVTLPRDVIDAKDDVFFVLVDGEEVDFKEDPDTPQQDMDRTLTIMFPAGAEEIEIIGTFVVPEFGTIAAMILAVAIISIIVISAKSRLSIIPRL